MYSRVTRVLLPAVLTLLVLSSCVKSPSEQPVPKTAPRLLVPMYFYNSYVVGKTTPPTGLLQWMEKDSAWKSLTWKELISSSVAVDTTGQWLYLACGNGVMVSRDAGQNWTLTGGWEMTEVQRVCIDSRDPRRAWAATAYGVFSCSDITSSQPWKKLPHDPYFRFCSDIVQDVDQPGTLWIATENGVFVSEDEGRTVQPRGPRVSVRRILQNRNDPEEMWAPSDGRGLLHSSDHGETWTEIDGLPATLFCIEQGATALACGGIGAVYLSSDGASWSRNSAGLPDSLFVFDIAFDPGIPDRLVLASNDGLYESRDGGSSWKMFSLEGAFIRDICFAPLALVPEQPPSREPGFLSFATMAERQDMYRKETSEMFFQRRDSLLQYFEKKLRVSGAKWPGFYESILEVRKGSAHPALWSHVKKQLDNPRHSMFFTVPVMALYLHCRDSLPEGIARQIQTVMTENPVYRGDTENHWVMYYSSLLLTAQTWPRTSPAQWYTHRTTQEIYDEARGWLLHWARLTATRGQGEFDSPHYIFMYLTPMFLLQDFAQEPEIRRMAGMMIDLLLADYLSESLRGAYCGGHSRVYQRGVQETVNNRVAVFHYLYAGGIPLPPSPYGWSIVAALSSYRPPALFEQLANNRDRPYVHTEVKRVRNIIRFSRALNPPVYKYDYMTSLYCLGSLQGGILQPIQQHTWDVTWLGSAANSVFFSMHPFVSGKELGMFFPEEIKYLTQIVSAQKKTYSSPDKLTSSSPYEKIFQAKNVLLALYQVPPGEQYNHVNVYFPRCLRRVEREGWIFGVDGRFYLAFYPGRSGDWIPHDTYDLFRCAGDRTGFVVITRSMDEPGGKTSFTEFQERILAGGKPSLTGHGDDMTLRFALPDGTAFERRWGDEAGKIDNKPVLFPMDRLFEGPYMHSRVESGVITMSDDSTEVVLDFNRLTTEGRKRKR